MECVKLTLSRSNHLSARWKQKSAVACWEKLKERSEELVVFTHLEDEAAAKRQAESSEGPLQGLCFATKDMFLSEGLPTSYGNSALLNAPPDGVDSGIVRRFKKLGAAHFGKVAMTEFALYTPAPSKNAFDPERTPGGSSCGSAVAVASGMCHAAIGSQTGGSMIRPAAYNGVFGMKPTWNLLPIAGGLAIAPSLDTAGIFTSSCSDMVAVMNALLGKDSEDAVKQIEKLWSGEKSLRGLRIGFFVPESCSYLQEAEQSTLDCVNLVLSIAKEAGAELKPVHLPNSFSEADIHTIFQFEALGSLDGTWSVKDIQETLSPYIHRRWENWKKLDTEHALQAYARGEKAKEDMKKAFSKGDGVDMIISPSTKGIAPLLADCLPSDYPSGDPYINSAWSFFGNPCLHLPVAKFRSMPLGVQVVGPVRGDLELLSNAARLLHVLANEE